MKKSQNRKGGIYLLIVLVALVFGFLLVGGIVPSFKLTPSDNSSEYEIITPGPQGGQNSLQLDPIKFKKCSSTFAVDFLLDRSNSMNELVSGNSKIQKLKEAVLAFANKMSDDSIIGMQDFSSPTGEQDLRLLPEYKELVPISYFRDVKQSIPSLVNSLQADGNTYTRDAFVFAKFKLDAAIPNFPSKYKFDLIFISDGVPHTPNGDFDPAQIPTDVAAQIKNEGITIFTIAYNLNDQKGLSLMQTLASNPSDAFVAPAPAQLDQILNQIAFKLCTEPQ